MRVRLHGRELVVSVEFDLVVIGAGPGGGTVATAAAEAGLRVAIVERERVGGECAFWACVPSKVLLRGEVPFVEASSVPGSIPGRLDFAAVADWRTRMVDHYDDAAHAEDLAKSGVTLVRGDATLIERGVVRVGERELRATNVVVASGSTEMIPPIDGLRDGPFWTPRDATAVTDLPESMIVIGGGAVGVEMSQAFARFGATVTLIEAGPELLGNEDPDAGRLMRESLEAAGIVVRTAAKVERVAYPSNGEVVVIASGSTYRAAVLLVAAGRKLLGDTLGLERFGVTVDEGRIRVDETCRAAPNLYAVGDVTGEATFTHVAKYQGRIVASVLAGRAARARYDCVPRCVYTQPEFAATGLTPDQARERGIDVVVATVDGNAIVRPVLHADPAVTATVRLIGDRAKRTLIGGWIVGPVASEMIAFVSSAIRTEATFEALLDVIQPYPTFSEAFYVAVDRLGRAASAV